MFTPVDLSLPDDSKASPRPPARLHAARLLTLAGVAVATGLGLTLQRAAARTDAPGGDGCVRERERGTSSQLPPAVRTGPLAVRSALEYGATADPAASQWLVVEVTASEAAKAARPPLRLALVVDRSGSMGSPATKIDGARRAVASFLAGLRPDDACAVVAFDDEAALLGQLRGGAGTPESLFAQLQPRGGTALQLGLEAGAAALEGLGDAPGAVRRVVLLTDGQDPSSTATLPVLASKLAARGISVSCHGFGADVATDLLVTTAEAGGGTLRYVDSPAAAVAAFDAELAHVAGTVARNLSVRLEPAPGVTIEEVVSWQATPVGEDGRGRRVTLGDVPGGATKKVVVRVRGPQEKVHGRTLPLVAVRWEGTTPEGAPLAGSSEVTCAIVDTAGEAEGSLRQELAGKLAQARFAHTMADVQRQLAAGDLDGARAAAKAAHARLDATLPGGVAAIATSDFVTSDAARVFYQTGELPTDAREAACAVPAACLPVGK